MAKQRMINTRFWSDSWVVDKLNPLDMFLFLYILSNDQANIAGIYELPMRIVAFQTKLDIDECKRMIERLEPRVFYNDGWIYVRRFADHQQSNPNIDKAIAREVGSLPPEIRKWIEECGITSQRLRKAFKDSESLGELNLTKLNLTKPNLTEKSEGFKKNTITDPGLRASYAKAVQADREQAVRAEKSKARTSSPTNEVDIDAIFPGLK
jgi:hypothetical protein